MKLRFVAAILSLPVVALAGNVVVEAETALEAPRSESSEQLGRLSPEQQSRQNFGLSIDDELIRERSLDESAVELYGMRLSTAEAQHVTEWMDFESTVVTEVVPALEQVDGFLGYYFQRGEDVTVVVVADESDDQVGDHFHVRSLGSRVTVVRRSFTHEQARAWPTALANRWSADAELPVFNSIALSTDWASLEVTTTAELPKQLQDRVSKMASTLQGSPVIHWSIEPPEVDQACVSRSSCTWPMKAGSLVTDPETCTVGFHVRVGSDEQFLTSGHCSGTGGSTTFSHAGWGVVGTTASNLFQPGWIDVQRVQMSDSQASSAIYGWSSSANITGHRYPGPGETICSSMGVRNETRCGYVASTATSWTSSTCNCTMTGADHNNIPSGGGDSGSPLFRSGSAIGVHATSGGKFTLVSDAMWLWGIDVVT